MKKILAVAILVSLAATPLAFAQQKSLASTLNVYVFPTKGQAPEQQSQDEAECYNWAVNQTGSDPFDLAKQSQQADAKAEQQKDNVKGTGGSTGRGALGGAAAGALVGEIVSDDPGKGAAIGAGVGALAGRRSAKKRQQAEKQQIEQQNQQSQQQIAGSAENFKKAFSACLEAKEYMVKY